MASVAVLLSHAGPAAAQSVQGKTHVLGKASGFVHLVAVPSPGQTVEFSAFAPDGTISGPFAIAPDTVFVATDLRVARTATNGLYEGRIVNVPSGERWRFHFDTNQHPSHHVGLTSGMVFSTPPRANLFANSAGAAEVHLHGYLAKNK
jgi:hypothetical protein